MSLEEFNHYVPIIQVTVVPAILYVGAKLKSIDKHLATLNGRMGTVETKSVDAEKLAVVNQASTTRELDHIHDQLSNRVKGKNGNTVR